VSKVENNAEAGATNIRRLTTGIAWVLGSLAVQIAGSFIIQRAIGRENFIHGFTTKAVIYALPLELTVLVMAIIGIVQIHRARAKLHWIILASIFGYMLALTYLFQAANMLSRLLARR
jgi:hypothetical protein